MESKFPTQQDCKKSGDKLVCTLDMNRKETVVLAMFGSESATYTATTPTYTGGERQGNQACFYDLDGKAYCS